MHISEAQRAPAETGAQKKQALGMLVVAVVVTLFTKIGRKAPAFRPGDISPLTAGHSLERCCKSNSTASSSRRDLGTRDV